MPGGITYNQNGHATQQPVSNYRKRIFEGNMQNTEVWAGANPKGRFEDLRQEYVSLIEQWMSEK